MTKQTNKNGVDADQPPPPDRPVTLSQRLYLTRRRLQLYERRRQQRAVVLWGIVASLTSVVAALIAEGLAGQLLALRFRDARVAAAVAGAASAALLLTGIFAAGTILYMRRRETKRRALQEVARKESRLLLTIDDELSHMLKGAG